MKTKIEITRNEIPIQDTIKEFSNHSVGAIVSFLGTTRSTFTDENRVTKQVEYLSYEGYEPMAIKVMSDIAKEAKAKYTDLDGVAIIHRLGIVGLAQESILVVTASPHRKDAIDAVGWIMDKVKKLVPIWKLEVYTDGSTWKENKEWRDRNL
ncbi:Molybdopterin synthase catalytic subunit [Boothiomyces sp. JEL0838]|nr:Molybdopterin synthase catalytic subunit [Boothiomyces sp. JEL0838]